VTLPFDAAGVAEQSAAMRPEVPGDHIEGFSEGENVCGWEMF
jgi:hypothetical protein